MDINEALFDKVRDLFNLQLDLVLWDATYFEGKAAEGLAQYGFSKDRRPDRLLGSSFLGAYNPIPSLFPLFATDSRYIVLTRGSSKLF
jgi:hypothetical protein